MQKLVEEFLQKFPGYLKKSPFKIADRLNLNYISDPDVIMEIKNIQNSIKIKIRKELELEKIKNNIKNRIRLNYENNLGTYNFEFAKIPEYNENLEIPAFLKEEDLFKKEINNILIIGDIHEPFTKEGYLEFCKEQYKKFNCNKVIFIGDIVDNAFSSFHPTNPDGYGAGDELDRAIHKITRWYESFPEATIIIGNHDRLAYRKAFAGGISSRWLRTYNEVLNAPKWKFVESIEVDNVLYIHGEAGTARMKAKDISQSVVQGHLHSQAYCEFINNRVFAMQVGAGIDDSQYAFNYNKAGKESIISCGIILDGKQPFLIKM